MAELLTKEILLDRARSVEVNINYDVKVKPIVNEVQQYDIKMQLGEAFYNILIDYIEAKEAGGTDNAALELLMNGGTYTYDGNKYRFDGLYTSVAYYTYARMIKSQAGNLGVTGMRTANDQYSTIADYKDRQTAYTDVKSMADSYMADCLSYLKRKKTETGFVGCDTRKRKTNIIVIKS